MVSVREVIDKSGYHSRFIVQCHDCSHTMYFYSIPPAVCDECGCALPNYRKLVQDKTYRLNWHGAS